MVSLPHLPEDTQATLTQVCPHLVVSECPLGQSCGQDWDLGEHQLLKLSVHSVPRDRPGLLICCESLDTLFLPGLSFSTH